MRQLEQPPLQSQSHQGSHVDVSRGTTEWINGINDRAVRQGTAKIVRGVGSNGGVGENVGGFAEVVAGGEGAECLVNSLTDGALDYC